MVHLKLAHTVGRADHGTHYWIEDHLVGRWFSENGAGQKADAEEVMSLRDDACAIA
jgi:hypothetical protein